MHFGEFNPLDVLAAAASLQSDQRGDVVPTAAEVTTRTAAGKAACLAQTDHSYTCLHRAARDAAADDEGYCSRSSLDSPGTCSRSDSDACDQDVFETADVLSPVARRRPSVAPVPPCWLKGAAAAAAGGTGVKETDALRSLLAPVNSVPTATCKRSAACESRISCDAPDDAGSGDSNQNAWFTHTEPKRTSCLDACEQAVAGGGGGGGGGETAASSGGGEPHRNVGESCSMEEDVELSGGKNGGSSGMERDCPLQEGDRDDNSTAASAAVVCRATCTTEIPSTGCSIVIVLPARVANGYAAPADNNLAARSEPSACTTETSVAAAPTSEGDTTPCVDCGADCGLSETNDEAAPVSDRRASAAKITEVTDCGDDVDCDDTSDLPPACSTAEHVGIASVAAPAGSREGETNCSDASKDVVSEPESDSVGSQRDDELETCIVSDRNESIPGAAKLVCLNNNVVDGSGAAVRRNSDAPINSAQSLATGSKHQYIIEDDVSPLTKFGVSTRFDAKCSVNSEGNVADVVAAASDWSKVGSTDGVSPMMCCAKSPVRRAVVARATDAVARGDAARSVGFVADDTGDGSDATTTTSTDSDESSEGGYGAREWRQVVSSPAEPLATPLSLATGGAWATPVKDICSGRWAAAGGGGGDQITVKIAGGRLVDVTTCDASPPVDGRVGALSWRCRPRTPTPVGGVRQFGAAATGGFIPIAGLLDGVAETRVRVSPVGVSPVRVSPVSVRVSPTRVAVSPVRVAVLPLGVRASPVAAARRPSVVLHPLIDHDYCAFSEFSADIQSCIIAKTESKLRTEKKYTKKTKAARTMKGAGAPAELPPIAAPPGVDESSQPAVKKRKYVRRKLMGVGKETVCVIAEVESRAPAVSAELERKRERSMKRKLAKAQFLAASTKRRSDRNYVKITGSYQNDFVYYATKKTRGRPHVSAATGLSVPPKLAPVGGVSVFDWYRDLSRTDKSSRFGSAVAAQPTAAAAVKPVASRAMQESDVVDLVMEMMPSVGEAKPYGGFSSSSADAAKDEAFVGAEKALAVPVSDDLNLMAEEVRTFLNSMGEAELSLLEGLSDGGGGAGGGGGGGGSAKGESPLVGGFSAAAASTASNLLDLDDINDNDLLTADYGNINAILGDLAPPQEPPPKTPSAGGDTSTPSPPVLASTPCKADAAPPPPPPLSSAPPDLTVVSMFWNDLPGLVIGSEQFVRLVDIHKQILPAKDTGILKKRCQMMGLEVLGCTELQRDFLLRYANAAKSKSMVIVSRTTAQLLIGFYVNPRPRTVRRAAPRGSPADPAPSDAAALADDHDQDNNSSSSSSSSSDAHCPKTDDTPVADAPLETAPCGRVGASRVGRRKQRPAGGRVAALPSGRPLGRPRLARRAVSESTDDCPVTVKTDEATADRATGDDGTATRAGVNVSPALRRQGGAAPTPTPKRSARLKHKTVAYAAMAYGDDAAPPAVQDDVEDAASRHAPRVRGRAGDAKGKAEKRRRVEDSCWRRARRETRWPSGVGPAQDVLMVVAGEGEDGGGSLLGGELSTGGYVTPASRCVRCAECDAYMCVRAFLMHTHALSAGTRRTLSLCESPPPSYEQLRRWDDFLALRAWLEPAAGGDVPPAGVVPPATAGSVPAPGTAAAAADHPRHSTRVRKHKHLHAIEGYELSDGSLGGSTDAPTDAGGDRELRPLPRARHAGKVAEGDNAGDAKQRRLAAIGRRRKGRGDRG